MNINGIEASSGPVTQPISEPIQSQHGRRAGRLIIAGSSVLIPILGLVGCKSTPTAGIPQTASEAINSGWHCVTPGTNEGYYDLFDRRESGIIVDYWENGSYKDHTTWQKVNANSARGAYAITGGTSCTS